MPSLSHMAPMAAWISPAVPVAPPACGVTYMSTSNLMPRSAIGYPASSSSRTASSGSYSMFHLSSQFGSWIEKAFTCISVPRPSRITSLMISLSMATDMAVRTLRARSMLASLPYSPIHGWASSGR